MFRDLYCLLCAKKTDQINCEIGAFEPMSPLFRENIWYESFVLSGLKLIGKFMPFRNIIPNLSFALLRRTLFSEHTLGRNVNLSRLEDWLLYIDLMQCYRVAYSSKILNYCCIHQGSVTRSHSIDSYSETIRQLLLILRKLSTLQCSNKEVIKRALKPLFKHRNKFKWAHKMAYQLRKSNVSFGLFGLNDLSKFEQVCAR
jgi:hypothetical protein